MAESVQGILNTIYSLGLAGFALLLVAQGTTAPPDWLLLLILGDVAIFVIVSVVFVLTKLFSRETTVFSFAANAGVTTKIGTALGTAFLLLIAVLLPLFLFRKFLFLLSPDYFFLPENSLVLPWFGLGVVKSVIFAYPFVREKSKGMFSQWNTNIAMNNVPAIATALMFMFFIERGSNSLFPSQVALLMVSLIPIMLGVMWAVKLAKLKERFGISQQDEIKLMAAAVFVLAILVPTSMEIFVPSIRSMFGVYDNMLLVFFFLAGEAEAYAFMLLWNRLEIEWSKLNRQKETKSAP